VRLKSEGEGEKEDRTRLLRRGERRGRRGEVASRKEAAPYEAEELVGEEAMVRRKELLGDAKEKPGEADG